ncbi:hypothetical protein ACH4E7_40185 [Kitasatospora sp. NPDC018058]|uniref:hypothetical protein n=1 Tax=Kitasatospora sp. NPDC018058 TaxID=3364025 RepID=UPI0037BFAF0E
MKGKAKETTGQAVGDRRITAGGKTQQTKADAEQTMEKIKDAAKALTPSSAARLIRAPVRGTRDGPRRLPPDHRRWSLFPGGVP